MAERQIKIPGPDHPIAIKPNPLRVIFAVGGVTVADSRNALTLSEAKYGDVQYIPLRDVDMTQLVRTEHTTYCPFKGDCAYYSLVNGGERGVNAVWTYEDPYPAVSAIKDHVAFYEDRVEISESI